MPFFFFLSAAQPTDQGEESVLLFVVVVGDCLEIFHVYSKWLHPERTFLQNGCIKSLSSTEFRNEFVCLLKFLFMS